MSRTQTPIGSSSPRLGFEVTSEVDAEEDNHDASFQESPDLGNDSLGQSSIRFNALLDFLDDGPTAVDPQSERAYSVTQESPSASIHGIDPLLNVTQFGSNEAYRHESANAPLVYVPYRPSSGSISPLTPRSPNLNRQAIPASNSMSPLFLSPRSPSHVQPIVLAADPAEPTPGASTSRTAPHIIDISYSIDPLDPAPTMGIISHPPNNGRLIPSSYLSLSNPIVENNPQQQLSRSLSYQHPARRPSVEVAKERIGTLTRSLGVARAELEKMKREQDALRSELMRLQVGTASQSENESQLETGVSGIFEGYLPTDVNESPRTKMRMWSARNYRSGDENDTPRQGELIPRRASEEEPSGDPVTSSRIQPREHLSPLEPSVGLNSPAVQETRQPLDYHAHTQTSIDSIDGPSSMHEFVEFLDELVWKRKQFPGALASSNSAQPIPQDIYSQENLRRLYRRIRMWEQTCRNPARYRGA